MTPPLRKTTTNLTSVTVSTGTAAFLFLPLPLPLSPPFLCCPACQPPAQACWLLLRGPHLLSVTTSSLPSCFCRRRASGRPWVLCSSLGQDPL